MSFADGMVILPYCYEESNLRIRPVGRTTFGTGVVFYLLESWSYPTTALVLWYGLMVVIVCDSAGESGRANRCCMWKPQLTLPCWKNARSTCGIGKMIADLRNNEGRSEANKLLRQGNALHPHCLKEGNLPCMA